MLQIIKAVALQMGISAVMSAADQTVRTIVSEKLGKKLKEKKQADKEDFFPISE